MSQILGYVFIGTKKAAQDEDWLKEHNISVIINCSSGEVENEFPDDYKYIDLDMEDTHNSGAKEYFEPVYEALKEVKEAKQVALVHCTNCKSMAPTIMISYMLNASAKAGKYLPLKKAMEFVQAKRPGSIPNSNFTNQLIELECELYEEEGASIRKASDKQFNSKGYKKGKGKKGK